jgi:hypothetical protein
MTSSTYTIIPNIDAVQEFKVVGRAAEAEFGGAAGGVVTRVSKSLAQGTTPRQFQFGVRFVI